ncbi:ABC transporter permease [Evansella cellulosilytica]|uniref:Binding-protein-dependent transport systems inner membrane component n=1 Tax=Evansella cellulosilytica (strain ATCC 21833 / DSM 2522 / FERM P-1141 / JCM 9156 / N-4) TaxID=649639 RepID=E6TSR6_EVAC2|nr:ABC transporter permease [Evansella cellulosilytica]ADU29574.1 binding-protein-dependent transport systems inner membrane component [Evansella cellulosilytica DSM 2522]
MQGGPAEKNASWMEQPTISKSNVEGTGENRIEANNKNHKRMVEKARMIVLPVIAGILFIVLWELRFFHTIFQLETYQLPLPSAILEALLANMSTLISYTGYTLTEAVVGMLLGSSLGFIVALVATAWPKWGKGSLTVVASLNAVPIVALAPIMNLWFGSGIGSRIAIVTIMTMAAMAINAYKGMNNVHPFALDLMHSYAATKFEIFKFLRIFNSLPYVFTALKINATASMIGAIVGEFFFSSRGLGYLLSNSIKIGRMPLGWACIIMAAIAGILFYFIVERLEKVFLKWHASERT